jgi:hypothetical protein
VHVVAADQRGCVCPGPCAQAAAGCS